MDIKNLVTFIHVAELRSFTKAGDKLGYSQSTVSFQIRQLENELGVPLFERINRTVTLTEPSACISNSIQSCPFSSFVRYRKPFSPRTQPKGGNFSSHNLLSLKTRSTAFSYQLFRGMRRKNMRKRS